MANLNSTNTFTSSTALTTAIVNDYFSVTDVPALDAIKASAVVSFAAETALQNGASGTSISIPLFSSRDTYFAPTRFVVVYNTAVVFAGTAAATATLGATLAIANTPTTLAITGPQLSPSVDPTISSALTSLVTAGGTGTNVMSASQFINATAALTSTNAMVVAPGKTLYLKFTTGGTTSANLTVTGTFKVYVCGDILPL